MLHDPKGIERIDFMSTHHQQLSIHKPRDGTIVEIELEVAVGYTPTTKWRVNGEAVKGSQGRAATPYLLIEAQGVMTVRMLACERRPK